jgi:hypothetical protein
MISKIEGIGEGKRGTKVASKFLTSVMTEWQAKQIQRETVEVE